MLYFKAFIQSLRSVHQNSSNCDMNLWQKHIKTNSRQSFYTPQRLKMDSSSCDADLVLIMLSKIKKRRFWVHSSLKLYHGRTYSRMSVGGSSAAASASSERTEQQLVGGYWPGATTSGQSQSEVGSLLLLWETMWSSWLVDVFLCSVKEKNKETNQKRLWCVKTLLGCESWIGPVGSNVVKFLQNTHFKNAIYN